MRDMRAKILWWAVRRRVQIDRPYIIAITGSIAKTSTKVAIGAVLRRAFPKQVRVGFGNLNSELGVPLAILGFKIDFYKQKISWQWLWILKLAIWRGLFSRLPKYIVLEYGADNPGDIARLASHLPIDAAIITLTGVAHLAAFPDVEAIATEKAKIFTALKKGGWGLVNKIDPNLKALIPKDRLAELIETETEDIAVNFARAVGRKLKIKDSIIEDALATLSRPEGRLQLKQLGPIKLLDDSYNANPMSMQAAFNVLAKLPGRKIAILGDMLELGADEKRYHREVGELAKKSADMIIGVGPNSKEYNSGYWYPDADTAAREVLTHLTEGATVLVKGSHGMHMDIIVRAIENKYKK